MPITESPLRRFRGFTLVEMSVALALLALTAAILLESLKLGQLSYEKVLDADRGIRDVFATQRLIRNLIESAYPVEAEPTGPARRYGLQGDRESISILAPAPLAAKSAGLYRFALTLRDGTEGRDLVVRWQPEFGGYSDTSVDEGYSQEVLLTNVATLEWSFLPKPQPGIPSKTTWQDTWNDPQFLPHTVRLKIQFPKKDRRHWPELVVGPKVTDDANCLFDIVAQSCRKPS